MCLTTLSGAGPYPIVVTSPCWRNTSIWRSTLESAWIGEKETHRIFLGCNGGFLNEVYRELTAHSVESTWRQ